MCLPGDEVSEMFSVAVRGATLLDESILLRIGRQTYDMFYASPFQRELKNVSTTKVS